MKDETSRKDTKECSGLRAKAFSSLIDDGSESKEARGTKNAQ